MHELCFTLVPFYQCLVGVEARITDSIEEFYLIDASDADNVKTNLISRIDTDQLHLLGKDNIPISKVEKVVLDWESNLMKQVGIIDNQKPSRAYGTTYKRAEYGFMGNRTCFMWNGVEEFKTQDIKFVNDKNEEGIAFVGGSMVMDTYGKVSLEKSENINSLKLEPCVEILPLNRKAVAVVIPCSDIRNRIYSLNGISNGKDTIFLFDLTSEKFEQQVTFIPFDNTFSFEESFGVGCLFVPYLENNRLRVFALQKNRLYEFVWEGEDYKSNLILIRHLEWIENINSIKRVDHFGLIISYRDKVKSSHDQILYTPQEFTSKHSKEEGEIRQLPTSKNDYYYAPKSKHLITIEQTTISKILTLEEIKELPNDIIKNIFNEQEYIENLKKDLQFNTYKPRLITDACEIIKTIPYNTRISEAYQIKEGRHNEIEIVAGIGCKKHADKLGDIIAEDYIELKPEDLADYLGAPIIYNSYILSCTSFIHDMVDLKRSSKAIEVVHISSSCHGKSYIYFTHDNHQDTFVGILSCKPKPDVMNDDDYENEEVQVEKEYETLFKRKEFQVESTKLRVVDPFSDSGVIINNARTGVWKWMTTHKSKDHVDGEYEDFNLIAQVVAIHQDYYQEISSDPKLWKVPDNVYRRLDRKQPVEKDDYYEDEIEGGWYLMKLGVGVDVAVAGIFDQKYFNNENALNLRQKKKTKLEEAFKFSYDSEWQSYFSKKMEQENYPSTMAAPYGIITSSGYGDGCYACLFKKSKSGFTVAVRLIFC